MTLSATVLIGENTVGLYSLHQDETCWVLAVNFDKKTWQQDAAAFLTARRELDVPAALERSRSGNGGHVWIFFEHAIPAIRTSGRISRASMKSTRAMRIICFLSKVTA